MICRRVGQTNLAHKKPKGCAGERLLLVWDCYFFLPRESITIVVDHLRRAALVGCTLRGDMGHRL